LNIGTGIKITENWNAKSIQDILDNQYNILCETPVIEKWVFFDTFDWRLYRKSLTLQKVGQELCLRNLETGMCEGRVTNKAWPGFASEVTDGEFRDRLESIIDIRALLMLSEQEVVNYIYRVLNKDKKIVARVLLLEIGTKSKSGAPNQASYLIILPVRGYPRYDRILQDDLQQFGEPVSVFQDLYNNAIKSSNLKQGGYSSRFDLQLDPNLPSDLALKTIFHKLLSSMRANEAGIKRDIDIEFLHDYRVSVRKSRSALSQLKGVFSPEITSKFKEELKIVGNFTNHLRDLDVYLLSEIKYKDMLPADLREGIQPLFDYLKIRREDELQNVITYLNSDKYRFFLQEWKSFIDADSDKYSGPEACIPIFVTSQKRIFNQYQRVISDGMTYLSKNQKELLHGLRIECKKLRYLIEFFSSLYPSDKISQLIKQLKVLQDNLGELNDLSIQQEYLIKIAMELPITNQNSKSALIATGCLVDALTQREKMVMNEFADIFKDFANQSNQDLYQELFKS